MDYNKQKKFLQLYHLSSLLVVLTTIVLEIYLYHISEYSYSQYIVNTVLTLALLGGFIYIPKYLNLTIETNKRYFWTVRIRWILSALLLFGTLPSAIKINQYRELVLGVILLLGTNFITNRLIKRPKYQLWGRTFGTIYAISDSAVLFLLFQTYHFNGLLQSLLCALGVLLAIQLGGFLPMIIFFGSMQWQVSPPIYLYLLLSCAGYALYELTRRHNLKNHQDTINQLLAFTSEPQAVIEDLLLNSTGMLAKSWHQKNPQGKAAIEEWYRENSPYYIYDLAQFHLAYKHIVFSLDIMSIAKGRVLDYGAGIGDLALALAAQGLDVTYFDVKGRSQAYALWQAEYRKLPVTFSSTHAEIADKQFDSIILLDVLEHLIDPQEVLDFLIQRLAPRGYLLVSAYFGATKAHPMHLDHNMDVGSYLKSNGLKDAKSLMLKCLGSEAIRRKPMYIYQK